MLEITNVKRYKLRFLNSRMNQMLKFCRCSDVFGYAEDGVAVHLPSSGWSQNEKSNNFEELSLVTNTAWQHWICWKTYNLKSYLLCQTISPFSATGLQTATAISHNVCDLPSYYRKSCKSQASWFNSLHTSSYLEDKIDPNNIGHNPVKNVVPWFVNQRSWSRRWKFGVCTALLSNMLGYTGRGL